jgi:hypothetical protein
MQVALYLISDHSIALAVTLSGSSLYNSRIEHGRTTWNKVMIIYIAVADNSDADP